MKKMPAIGAVVQIIITNKICPLFTLTTLAIWRLARPLPSKISNPRTSLLELRTLLLINFVRITIRSTRTTLTPNITVSYYG
ncbi:cell division control protein cdc48 [Moniliophthora roreri]|nr:cell division control protein cdc48 [Moniliophthora roreri]